MCIITPIYSVGIDRKLAGMETGTLPASSRAHAAETLKVALPPCAADSDNKRRGHGRTSGGTQVRLHHQSHQPQLHRCGQAR